jgi:hypothetical protein
MDNKNISLQEPRRDRTGGIVRDKLDLLMMEMRKEDVPSHLIKLAEELQSALDEKTESAKTPT